MTSSTSENENMSPRATENTSDKNKIVKISLLNTEELIDFLKNTGVLHLNDTHLEVFRKHEISGYAFLDLTEKKFISYGLKEGTSVSLAKFAKECKMQIEKSLLPYDPLKENEFYDIVEFVRNDLNLNMEQVKIFEEKVNEIEKKREEDRNFKDICSTSSDVNSEVDLNGVIDRINKKMTHLLEEHNIEYQQITKDSDDESSAEAEEKNTDDFRSSDNIVDTSDTTNTFNQFQQELEEYINNNISTEGGYICWICNKNLGSDKTLYRHVTEQHTNVRYRCDQCTYECKRLDNLNLHKMRKH